MIINKTYNNIINTLKNVGAVHKHLTTTTTGDIHDIDLSKNTLFPLMHINPVGVATKRATIDYTFQIFVMDLVSQDADWTEQNIQSAAFLNNEQEVLSSTLQTSIDIVSMFRNSIYQSSQQDSDINAPIIFAEEEFNLEPFTERFDNLLTGWVFQITLNADNNYQSCNIPLKSDLDYKGLVE
jgi:hypothetical protein